jgi:hypothetical protein
MTGERFREAVAVRRRAEASTDKLAALDLDPVSATARPHGA